MSIDEMSNMDVDTLRELTERVSKGLAAKRRWLYCESILNGGRRFRKTSAGSFPAYVTDDDHGKK